MFFKEVLEKERSRKIKTVLLEQKKKYDYLKTKQFYNFLFSYLNSSEIVLPPNTLLHGTKFDIETLKSIKRDGILASEFSKNCSDYYNETFYMADFFKNVTDKNITVKELLNCYNGHDVINYLPNDKNSDVKRVAFIVNTQDKQIENYLKLDLFSKNNESLYSFIDEEMFFSIERRKMLYQYSYKLGQASIPVGVPYSALCGVIIDKTIEENKNGEFDTIKNLFGKELFIISSKGKVLHLPQASLMEEVQY